MDVVAMVMVVRRRRLHAAGVTVLCVQRLDLGRPPLHLAQRCRGVRRGPSRSQWGHRCGVGWPRWNKGPWRFDAFAAKQGTQEGAAAAAVVAAADPPRSAPCSCSLDTAGDSPNSCPSSGMLLPRPTPHPHSGAQDGAVRPEVFCYVAAGDDARHRVPLVRLRAVNDGALEEGGEKRGGDSSEGGSEKNKQTNKQTTLKERNAAPLGEEDF